MGDPARKRRTFSRPQKPWDQTNLENERKLTKSFGLKNKRELWRAQATIRKKRQSARKLLAMTLERRSKSEKELVGSLQRIGLLKSDAGIDDLLGLNTAELLERRLQTVVVRKALANTPKQARQFIVHGHISVNGKKVTRPSYLVRISDTIAYYGKPLIIMQAPKKETKKEEPTSETQPQLQETVTEESKDIEPEPTGE